MHAARAWHGMILTRLHAVHMPPTTAQRSPPPLTLTPRYVSGMVKPMEELLANEQLQNETLFMFLHESDVLHCDFKARIDELVRSNRCGAHLMHRPGSGEPLRVQLRLFVQAGQGTHARPRV